MKNLVIYIVAVVVFLVVAADLGIVPAIVLLAIIGGGWLVWLKSH